MRSRTPIGQRFRPDDQVKEAPSFGREKDTFKRRVGTVTECITKFNKRGAKNYYYYVIWEGSSHPNLLVQHRLKHLDS